MAKWVADRETGDLGRFQIVFSKPGGRMVDVTYFRGVPTQLENYSSGDPFGDASCVIAFPQIGGFDDLTSADVGTWLGDFSNVDIFWLDYVAGTQEIDPRTNQPGLKVAGREKIWEGYVADMGIAMSEGDDVLSVQCQGGLYQVDRYLEKPQFPPRPIPHELLLQRVFDKRARPHLRTQPLRIEWPNGWQQVVEAYEPYTGINAYTPAAPPGSKYTGYSTRETGRWDRSLTGFCQDLLSVMFVDVESGVTPGNQWTIHKDTGRQPVLRVRDRFRAPDFSLWYGQTGVTGQLNRDTTQMANVIYGEGQAVDGTTWRNAVISNDGSRTDYVPLAHSRAVWPPSDNKHFDKRAFTAEGFYKYGPGFGLDQAIQSAAKSLARDQQPGWSGELTAKVDPPELSRWKIKAGMTVKVKGFMGTGEAGVNFHVAEVTANPKEGTVTLTLDTRYRDLLNLEEARSRTRDPLTPSKMLQVNRRSVMIEDTLAPWDYSAGSGFIPRASTKFHAHRPMSQPFPWQNWIKAHPPRYYSSYYTRVNADKADRYQRWTLGKDVPILLSQKGTIRRVEIVACNVEGDIIPVPFHFSLYKVNVTVHAMPRDAGGPSPFLVNAFESVDASGAQVSPYLKPDPSIIIGWGNRDQPAGYSPGRKSDGSAPTGILVDESSWTYDLTEVHQFYVSASALPNRATPPDSIMTAYGAFYAEWSEPVYFIGRMYRQEPGT